ncbi:MAG: HNH endonuclease [Proteobacteria bacterium]|nr:HNH endonuclease [Pseudomonadota bacterium]
MQEITGKLKNSPRNTPHVPCSESLSLNRVQRLSEADKVLPVISPEVDQPEYTQGLKAIKVYVLAVDGTPLMPCSACKAKKLLKQKQATVVKRVPFTIQLNFECENKVQRVILGIDSGYENIGFSLITKTKELISGTIKLDGKTSERLTERRMYRRNRRNKLWYRKPRFNNRTKPEGWLPPSVQRRYDTHLNLINKLKKIVPVNEIIIETAKFDIQKIMDPSIEGAEYQQGSLYEYQNMRSFLMAREQGKCQLCGKNFKNQSSHIHHCKQRSESGSNRAENLAILHKRCHTKLHKQGLKLSKPKNYNPGTFMSIINKKFYQDISDVKITYGHITFVKRNELGLKKSHSTDAFVIASGTNQEKYKSWNIEQKHRNNRAIQLNRKGFKPSVRKQRYEIQPKDLVWLNDQIFSVVGIQNKGSYVKLKDCSKVMPVRNIEKSYNFGGLVWN